MASFTAKHLTKTEGRNPGAVAQAAGEAAGVVPFVFGGGARGDHGETWEASPAAGGEGVTKYWLCRACGTVSCTEYCANDMCHDGERVPVDVVPVDTVEQAKADGYNEAMRECNTLLETFRSEFYRRLNRYGREVE